MPNRNKRLTKGIRSIEEQIRRHEQKLKKAKSDGNEGLVSYYEKELIGMKNQIKRKKEGLGG